MSVLNRQPNGAQSCFGLCLSQEDSNQDVLMPQRSLMSTEDERMKKEIDSMLSEAMNELTFQERQRQQEVLHGVEDQIVEEATFIESALEELEFHLSCSKHGSVYEIAEQMDPTYVQEKTFRVMFLRCKDYDAKAAADQMLLFFKMKMFLFGPEKLVQEITIEDLDEDDRASLTTGWTQFVGKDRSDRVVQMYFPGLRAFRNLKNEWRGAFFMLMHLLKSDEASQLKGVVGILYSIGEFRDCQNGAGYTEHAQLINAIPLKRVAIHLCVDDISEYFLYNMAIKVMPAKLRSQFRCHFGSHLESQYRLSTYGVSKMLIPIDEATGVINLDHHRRWYQSCLPLVEDVGSVRSVSPDTVTDPTENDVLYGGKSQYHHMGNRRVRTLVIEWSPVYDSGNKNTKRIVVDNIIQEIMDKSGGRFLKRENGGWQSLPLERVRMKITQMFRNRRRNRSVVHHKEDTR